MINKHISFYDIPLKYIASVTAVAQMAGHLL